MFYGIGSKDEVDDWKANPNNQEFFNEAMAQRYGWVFNEDTITSTTKSITFSGNGVRVIFVPKSLGALTAIRDGINNNVIHTFTRVEVTIDGTVYYLYDDATSSLNINLMLTLVY
jgi:3-polyprenyl-4-hydroxybenzoate decarboxylase